MIKNTKHPNGALYIFYKVWTEIEHACKYNVYAPNMDKFENGNGGKSYATKLLSLTLTLLWQPISGLFQLGTVVKQMLYGLSYWILYVSSHDFYD